MICNAWVEKYVGKGLERVRHTGQCPLEQGHDSDHVPPSLLNTGYTQVPSDQLDEAKAIAAEWAESYAPYGEGLTDKGARLFELLRSWG